jgi:hypothetical protein
MFVNKPVRRIFRPKMAEVQRGWRKVLNEELHNLWPKPNVIRVVRSRKIGWAAYIACMRNKKNSFKILICQPEEKRPLGTARV